MTDWIDISVTIRPGIVSWPGEPSVDVHRIHEISEGDEANVTNICMSVHTGTHIDAPLHFINGGHDVIGFSLHTFIGRVKIFEIKNNSEISLNDVQDLPINSNDRVFFKTKNSDVDWINQPFNRNYIHLSLDAAKYLSDRNIIAIGIDYLSIGGLTDGAEVHLALLRKNILIIEGLQLREIIPGEYDMICLPIKIKNSDGSPARVIIRKA